MIVRLAGNRATAIIGLLLIFAAAGLVSAGHFYVFQMQVSGDWQGMIIVKLLVWIIWAFFALAILEAAHRFPLDQPHRIRHLFMQFFAATVLTGVYLLCYAALLQSMARVPLSYDVLLTVVMREHSTYYLLAGWAIVMLESLIHHVEELHLRSHREEELKLRMERARLDAIHARLRPHFLFNALNSLSSQIVRGDRESANETVAALADLLRATLERTDDGLVPLREEVRLIHLYLDIVKRRFRDRLTVSLQVGDEAATAQIPSFILQNLVENAVKHGIEKAEGTMRLEVAGSREGDLLHLKISNTLAGAVDDRSDGIGFGLRSVRERLKLYYGDACRFKAVPSNGCYVVSLTVPVRSSAEVVND